MLDLHYVTHDIIIGRAEIFYSHKQQGWVIPGGEIIKDKVQAIQYACKLHDLLTQQYNLQKQKDKR